MYEIINNKDYRKICFNEAINLYKAGRTVECRIFDQDGTIRSWEKYNKCEGLEIALEFKEIINGTWYVLINGY